MGWRVLGWAAAALAATLLSASAFVHAPWGAARLAGLIERRVSAEIEGDLHVGALSVSPWGIRARRVMIVDRRDRPVIAAREVVLSFEPLALLVGRIHVEDLLVRGGFVEVAYDPAVDDVGIGQAFGPEEAAPKKPKRGPPRSLPPPPPLPIRVDRVHVEDTAFRLALTPGAPPEVVARDLAVELEGAWDHGAWVTVDVVGRILVPVEAPLSMHVESSFADDLLAADKVAITVGQTQLKAKGLAQMRALDGNVRLEAIAGAPEARAFGIPLGEDVHVVADMGFSRERIGGDVRAQVPGRGLVEAEVGLSPEDGTARAEATLEALDPRAWVQGLPAGQLSGAIVVSGDLTPEPRLDVDLSLERGLLAGERFGPARLRGALAGDRIRIDEGRADLAGAALSFSGTAAPAGVDLEAELRATDIAATARLLAALGLDLPSPGGAGTFRASAAGRPERPVLGLQVDVPRLQVGAIRAGGVRLLGAGRIGADGLPALELSGRADSLAGVRFHGAGVQLSASRQEDGAFDLRATSGSYELEAGGDLRPGRAVVERFRFRYPEDELRLDAPATIEAGQGVLAIRELRLSGPGRISGSASIGHDRLDVDLVADQLRLERLPQALVPEDISGLVELRARVNGSPKRPVGRVRFRVADGRYGPVGGLAANGAVRLGDGRAAGRIALRLREAGTVQGSFDVPLDPLDAPASAPVRLDLTGAPIELSALGEAVGTELPRATMLFRVAGSGTVGAPHLRLESQILDVILPGRALPAADATLTLELDGGLATVDVEGRVVGRQVLRLDATAPFELRRFAEDPAGEVRRLLGDKAVRIEAEARGFDLAFLAPALEQPEVTGPVAVVVDLDGPLVEPRGTVRADIAARSLWAFDRVDGRVDLELGDRNTRIDGQVAIDGGRVSSFTASVGAALSKLLDGTAAAGTPVALSVDIPGLRLRRSAGGTAAARAGRRERGPKGEAKQDGRFSHEARVRKSSRSSAGVTRGQASRPGGLPPPIPSTGQPLPTARLTGTITGGGRFEGTLARLEGGLQLVGRNLAVGDVRLGDVELSVRQGEVLEARLDAIDPTAGTLTATARVEGQVAPLGLLRGRLPTVAHLPATVTVDGTALSLAPLGLVPAVTAAAGTVSVELQAAGTLGHLEPRGRLLVDDGRVELAIGQVFEGVEALATFEGDRLELRQLLMRTPGRGSLDARGSLMLVEGADPLALVVRAEEFPIGGPGGVTARITGTVEGKGRLGGIEEGLDASVVVPDLMVAIPRRPPREIHPIARHRDVAIVTGPEALQRMRRSRVQQEALAIPVTIAVEAPDVRVRGEDIDARLSAALTLTRGPAAGLLARGEIRSERSTARVLGRRFDVERGVARFDGALDQPFLDATARYEGREATAWVDVVGPADNLQVRLRSDPPLPESQIAVLIASGRIPAAAPAPVGTLGPVGERAPPGEAVAAGGAAASIAGSYLAARLRGIVGPKLPLDVLVLESGREGGTRIEAGTFLGERLYVGYLRELLPARGENLNEIRAEYRLTPSFSLESFFGDAATGGVDLVFERTVPTGSQRTARREAAAARSPEVEPTRSPKGGAR